MSSSGKLERDERRPGNEVALRVGGAVTGVGIAAGVLYLFGSDNVFTASLSAPMIVIGIVLLVIGYRARRQHRR